MSKLVVNKALSQAWRYHIQLWYIVDVFWADACLKKSSLLWAGGITHIEEGGREHYVDHYDCAKTADGDKEPRNIEGDSGLSESDYVQLIFTTEKVIQEIRVGVL